MNKYFLNSRKHISALKYYIPDQLTVGFLLNYSEIRFSDPFSARVTKFESIPQGSNLLKNTQKIINVSGLGGTALTIAPAAGTAIFVLDL